MEIRELKPNENMHLKNINTGDIYEGTIYLGIYDTPNNYIEVTEKEYQDWLNEKAEALLEMEQQYENQNNR